MCFLNMYLIYETTEENLRVDGQQDEEVWRHELEEWVGRGQIAVCADDHSFHEKVCVTQVSEGLMVLSLCIVVEHLGHQPGVGRIIGSVHL